MTAGLCIDPWGSEDDDELPIVGALALALTAAGVTIGVLGVCAGLAGLTWARNRLPDRR